MSQLPVCRLLTCSACHDAVPSSETLHTAAAYIPPVPFLQYLIPMLGMLLGNACSGVAVGLSTVLDELSSGAPAALCCACCACCV